LAQPNELETKNPLFASRIFSLVSLSQMRSRKPFFLAALPTGAAVIAITLAGCKPLPPSKPASEWTAQEARGAAVFQANCARCHHPTTTNPLHGPGLQAITKIKSMPSGAPPTDERLTDRILHGYGMMPATPLTDDQLQDLLAYLHTL
jgi:mono/diheme cytochrome c family protein